MFFYIIIYLTKEFLNVLPNEFERIFLMIIETVSLKFSEIKLYFYLKVQIESGHTKTSMPLKSYFTTIV
ncbi:hypothetical protein RhiirC2_737733 [Rhizophagus irregularis]|uniref:Uncharacterized protein n=1 Tax=Rhizophagus irregularis TaxID=588596 RepID=A0A2N1NM34_9GLOM|nr:hypothetical protein RhiirC2_737733 [Rhizophagus irregularis]